MRHDWILGVLSDLQTFAKANGLKALGEQLDDTRLIAMAEIACVSSEGQVRVNGDPAFPAGHTDKGRDRPDA